MTLKELLDNVDFDSLVPFIEKQTLDILIVSDTRPRA